MIIMNNCIKSISKIYLIMLIPFSFLVINNMLIFAEDTQQQQKQNATIASDDEDLFTFFENFKNENATEKPIVSDDNCNRKTYCQ